MAASGLSSLIFLLVSSCLEICDSTSYSHVYSNSPPKVNKYSIRAWSFEEVNEGPCLKPSPKPGDFNTTWLFQALKDDWYVPMASKMYIYNRSKYQKQNITAKYLETLCLKFNPAATVSTIVGLENNSSLSCRSEKIGEQLCLVKITGNGSVALRGEIEGISTWTDNQKLVVMAFCSAISGSQGNRMWALLSNTRNITKEDNDAVLENIEKIGFNRKFAYKLNYEKCTEIIADKNDKPKGNVTESP